VSSTAANGLDPVAERLLEESRERAHSPLHGHERVARWLSAGAFVAVAVPLAAVGLRGQHLDPFLAAGLIGAFALASTVEFEVGTGFAVPTELALVPMLFLLPPLVVPACVAVALVLGRVPDQIRSRAPAARLAVPIGNAWFALGPALVFAALPHASGLRTWSVLAAALLAQFAADFASTAIRERLALGVGVRDLVRPLLWVFVVDACLAPIGLAVALAAETTRAALLLPLPLIALLSIFSRERATRLGRELELSHAYRGTAFLLGDVVEADDAYTGAHSREVVDLVLGVCDELGLDERSRRTTEFAALLHDVGKIKIPSEIINKPGPLTPEERAIINTHTIEGERLLTPIGGLLAEVGVIVRSCHERYDGAGYPDGLAGDGIPLGARIVSACDALNAMVTDRSYRKALPHDAALAEMRANSGSQFDPEVVDALIRVGGT
jgi:HD-GYP domain-containing protein (c-di-GMP phosphodiesterase class II)